MTSGANSPTPPARTSAEEVTIPEAKVSVYEALYRRRMAWQFKDWQVPRETLERMLATAVWAPNHRLTEPWRFFVLEKGGEARTKAADLAYEFSMERNNDSARAEAARRAVLDPPVVVYIYCVPGPNDEATKENYGAVCCAAHNVSLAGVAEGLAVTWETGGVTRHPKLRQVLGAEADWQMAVMLSIGAPATTPSSSRTEVSHFVSWV
ncbi:MAG: nitroreductase [Chloroflexota bacterium]